MGLSGPMDIIASLPSAARLSGVLRMRIVETACPGCFGRVEQVRQRQG